MSREAKVCLTCKSEMKENKADIRLLVLDIDGTIADKSNRLRDSVAQAVCSAQSRGVAVAIATGRLYQNSLHAHDFIGSTLPLICNDGALIREPKTEIVHRHWPVEPRAVAQVLDYTEHPSLSGRVSVQFYVQHDLYVSNLNDASVKFFEGSKLEPIVVGDLRQLLDRATTEVIVLSDEVEVIARLASLMESSYSRTRVKEHKSMPFLEVFHEAVNKRLAVSYLAEEIMSIRPENVMAIGDDFTDIEMLEYAGIGVAMGTAPMEVKAVADWVTTSLEEDGVARAIDTWILQAQV